MRGQNVMRKISENNENSVMLQLLQMFYLLKTP